MTNENKSPNSLEDGNLQLLPCQRQEKTQRDGKTQSHLRVLSPEDRVEEVARMLAGISITDSTKSVAREMLAQPTE